MMSIETCGKIIIFLGFSKMIKLLVISCMSEIMFSKENNSRYEILNHLYFGPNFGFWEQL